VTGDEKRIFYDNPKKKKYYAKPGQSLPSTSTPWPKSATIDSFEPCIVRKTTGIRAKT